MERRERTSWGMRERARVNCLSVCLSFRKGFLALSRDVGTVRVHRDSTALFRCKSGTGPRPGITSASPSIVVVIAALHYIMFSMPRDNDGAREDGGKGKVYFPSPTFSSVSPAHSPHGVECAQRKIYTSSPLPVP